MPAFVDAGKVGTQSLILPIRQNQQIGFQCQYFFNGERADFHLAHVGKLVQLGHGLLNAAQLGGAQSAQTALEKPTTLFSASLPPMAM